MSLEFKAIKYIMLTAKQQEAYNFQKVSAVLTDFGWFTLPLKDDWNGADFLARSEDGKTIINVQLKSRLSFAKKYQEKKLWICFAMDGCWYLYPHDRFLETNLGSNSIGRDFWENHTSYSNGHPSEIQLKMLKKYQIKEGLILDTENA